MGKEQWHFPRSDLAEKTLNLVVNGPSNAITMFGPRRMGKTEFLLEDLGPLAEKRGHPVIYVSFWQSRLSPLAVLLNELEIGLTRISFTEKLRRSAETLSPKLKLSGSLFGAKLESEVDLTKLRGEAPTELLLYLDDLMRRVSGKKQRTLIFFDEIQELARVPENNSLIAALRTSLDKQKNGISVVFTGSSRAGLAAMFSDREAPFFHFAIQIDLPPLGDDFVEHMLNSFSATTTRKLDRGPAVEAFEELHRNPYFFRGLLEVMIYDDSLTVPEALEQQRNRIKLELQYPEKWLSLTPIQRACALTVARGEKPFTKKTREKIGRLLKETAPDASRVQAALRKLERNELIDRWQGEWMIEDAEFARWIRAREQDI